jgi:DNA-binding IclR family transcriptional regulator
MQRSSTVDKSLSILEATRDAGEKGRGVRELSRLLGINPATVHNLAWTLSYRGYLSQNPKTRRFVLGPACQQLANSQSPWRDLAEKAGPLVRQCQRELDESIMLAALHGNEVVSLVYIPSTQALRVDEPEVMGNRAYGTAVGKMLLSSLPEPALQAYLRAHPPQAFMPRTLATPEAIRKGLDTIRKRGYSETRDEMCLGVSAMAVLVKPQAHAGIVAGLGASAPTIRMDARLKQTTLTVLRRFAGLIDRAEESQAK